MSETAPTTLTLDDRYKNGRPGHAEVQTDVPLTPINPELEATQPTAGQLFEALTQLETARAANPNGLASAKDFLRNPPKGSDDEVYLKVLERLNNANEALQPHEVRVLRHIEMELALNNAAASIDGSVIKNRNVLVAKTTDVLNAVKDDFDQTDESEKPEKFKAFRAIANTLEDFTKNRQNNEGGKSPLAQYFEAVEAQKDNPNPNALAKASEALQKEETRQGEHLATYTVLGGKYPVGTQVEVEAEEAAETTSPEQEVTYTPEEQQKIAELEQKLAEVENKIGKSYARREAKIRGLDNVKVLKSDYHLQETYRELSLALFQLTNAKRIADPNLSIEEKILDIAEFTVARGKHLEEIKIKHFENSRFGKVARFLGRHIMVAGAVGIVAGLAASTVTGGAAAGVTAGAMAYLKRQGDRREKRVGEASIVHDDDSMYEVLRTMDGAGNLADKDITDELFNHALGANDERFESKIRKEQNGNAKDAAIGLGAAALGFGLAHAVGLANLGDHATHALANQSPDLNLAPHAGALDTSALHNIYSGPSSINVNPGDGFFKVFEQMNIPQDQWNDVLGKVSSNLVGHGDAYWMPDGTAGISAPGQMSQFAFDAIKQAANFR